MLGMYRSAGRTRRLWQTIMKRQLITILVLLAAAVWLLAPAPVSASEQLLVSSNGPSALLIDGEMKTRFPVAAELGAEACVSSRLSYISDVERLAFTGWSHGPKDECVTLLEPGDYTAIYTHEVLLKIRSDVRAYRTSAWVPTPPGRTPLTRCASPSRRGRSAGSGVRKLPSAQWCSVTRGHSTAK